MYVCVSVCICFDMHCVWLNWQLLRDSGNDAVNTLYIITVDTPPVMDTCQVKVLDAANTETMSRSTGDCRYQRDEIINTQPNRLHFKIGAQLTLSTGAVQPFIHSSEVGVVGTKVTVVKISVTGKYSQVHSF